MIDLNDTKMVPCGGFNQRYKKYDANQVVMKDLDFFDYETSELSFLCLESLNYLAENNQTLPLIVEVKNQT